MACKEDRSFEKRVASLLADKWDRLYSELVDYVRGNMAMSIIHSNNVCLRGAPGKEAGGAVDGGWRHLRGDAGVDGGLGILPARGGVQEIARIVKVRRRSKKTWRYFFFFLSTCPSNTFFED